ncbi:hypothetical protein MMC27_003675 [Xylographa pallens]|nr:hypothetical protein [Xylographa pallens]
MFSKKQTSYDPLSSSDGDDSALVDSTDMLRRTQRKQKITTCFLCVATLLLLASNLTWLWRLKLLPSPASNFTLASLNNNNGPTVSKRIFWSTPFAGKDKYITNSLWRDLFPTTEAAGLVSLPTSWALSQNLPTTVDDQHTPGNGVYFVAAYHQLHCLSVLRAALYHYHEGATQTVEWMHMVHCVDSLRQALMCSADDTLLYTNGNGTVGVSQKFGDGQLRVCRDWEALRTWTEGHRLEA